MAVTCHRGIGPAAGLVLGLTQVAAAAGYTFRVIAEAPGPTLSDILSGSVNDGQCEGEQEVVFAGIIPDPPTTAIFLTNFNVTCTPFENCFPLAWVGTGFELALAPVINDSGHIAFAAPVSFGLQIPHRWERPP